MLTAIFPSDLMQQKNLFLHHLHKVIFVAFSLITFIIFVVVVLLFHPRSAPPRNTRVICQICFKIGHTTLECYQRMNFAYQGREPPQNLSAMLPSANILCENLWYMDSGATNHFTYNMD